MSIPPCATGVGSVARHAEIRGSFDGLAGAAWAAATKSGRPGAGLRAPASRPASAWPGQDRGGLATLDDVGELVGLGRRVDRAEGCAGLEGREDRDGRFPAIIHEDEHAVAALHPIGGERGCQSAGEIVQLGISSAACAR